MSPYVYVESTTRGQIAIKATATSRIVFLISPSGARKLAAALCTMAAYVERGNTQSKKTLKVYREPEGVVIEGKR
jgi:hypothetical protein